MRGAERMGERVKGKDREVNVDTQRGKGGYTDRESHTYKQRDET